MLDILTGVLALGGIGLVFGLLLTLANKIFEIPSDPKRDAVRNEQTAAAAASPAATHWRTPLRQVPLL